MSFQPFAGHQRPANVLPDATVCFPDTSLYCPDGGGTLRVVVPGPGDPQNAFAGGTLVAGLPRNLSGFDAVTFWAKSTRAAPLIIGLGADQSDTPSSSCRGARLAHRWTQYVLPIPLATRLTAERGLFYFSAGADGSPATGFTFWLADIQYVTLGASHRGAEPRASRRPASRRTSATAPSRHSRRASTMPVAFAVQAAAEIISASNRYFTFTSSDPAVATVDPGGAVSVQGTGTATVSALLGGIEAAGPLTVKVGAADTCPPLAVPADIAPTPTVPGANVISLFGSAYLTPRSFMAHGLELLLQRLHADELPAPEPSVKKYASAPFVGHRLRARRQRANQIDASAMTWFHLDVWTPNGFAFNVKLVNDPGGFQSESTVR